MEVPSFFRSLFPRGQLVRPIPEDLLGRQIIDAEFADVGTTREDDDGALAPWPIVDKYPFVIGQHLTMATISAAMRTATMGYRLNWVDILNELVEREPHGQAVLAQRFLSVAGGRMEVIPAAFEAGSNDAKAAKEVATWCEEKLSGIPKFKRAVSSLLWGIYYGVSANEVIYERDGNEWTPVRLAFIHSRRISYPAADNWDAYIWDQGPVANYRNIGQDPTSKLFGLKMADYPGKFILHEPQVRGDYPTREGLGRILGFWFALKALAVRGGAQTVERFAKPWAIAYFATQRDGHPRAATDDDIQKADSAVRALGMGSLSAATLPDSVKVVLERIASAAGGGLMTHGEFIKIINAEISKVVLGQTDTTEAGPNGSRSATETRKEGTQEQARYDADCVCEDIVDCMLRPLLKFSRPQDLKYCPTLKIHPAETPDPDSIMKRAKLAADCGMPVDADKVGPIVGLPLIANEDNEPRRLYPMALMKPIDIQSLEKLDAGEELEPPAPPALPGAKPAADTPPADATPADKNGATKVN